MTLNILKYRKSSERFVSKREWLDSKHSFSFGEHRDQLWDNFGKIRVINEDIISPNSGFGSHSHSNMEIVTIVIEGEITHRDSLNNLGIIYKDEVQVMSAGTGITHSEKNEKNTDCKLFQIWIYPQVKDLKPSYKQIPIKNVSGNNLLVDSSKRNNCLLFINQDISIWRCKYNLLDKKYLPSEIKRFNWIQIIKGNLFLRDKNNKLNKYLFSGDGLGFEVSDISDIEIQSDTNVDMILLSMSKI